MPQIEIADVHIRACPIRYEGAEPLFLFIREIDVEQSPQRFLPLYYKRLGFVSSQHL